MDKLEQYLKNNREKHVKIIAKKLNGDYATAEDVIQDAHIKIFRYYPTYDETRSSFNHWAMMILFSVFHSFRKKVNSMKKNEERNYPKEFSNWSDDDINHAKMLINEIENDSHREIVNLYYNLGYNIREISEVIGESVTNVKQVLYKFRDNVKKGK